MMRTIFVQLTLLTMAWTLSPLVGCQGKKKQAYKKAPVSSDSHKADETDCLVLGTCASIDKVGGDGGGPDQVVSNTNQVTNATVGDKSNPTTDNKNPGTNTNTNTNTNKGAPDCDALKRAGADLPLECELHDIVTPQSAKVFNEKFSVEADQAGMALDLILVFEETDQSMNLNPFTSTVKLTKFIDKLADLPQAKFYVVAKDIAVSDSRVKFIKISDLKDKKDEEVLQSIRDETGKHEAGVFSVMRPEAIKEFIFVSRWESNKEERLRAEWADWSIFSGKTTAHAFTRLIDSAADSGDCDFDDDDNLPINYHQLVNATGGMLFDICAPQVTVQSNLDKLSSSILAKLQTKWQLKRVPNKESLRAFVDDEEVDSTGIIYKGGTKTISLDPLKIRFSKGQSVKFEYTEEIPSTDEL